MTNTIHKVKVKNMIGNSGREVVNQFILTTDEGEYFQSYASIIGFWSNDGKITLDENKWDYSTTTGKYRNKWLGEKKADTLRKIKSNQYKLADLN